VGGRMKDSTGMWRVSCAVMCLVVATGAVALAGTKNTSPRKISGRTLGHNGALPVTSVEVRRGVASGRGCYKYSVVNGTEFPITTILIGFDLATGQPELPMFDDAVLPSGASAPDGWHLVMQPTEEDSLGSIEVESDGPAHNLGKGKVLDGIR